MQQIRFRWSAPEDFMTVPPNHVLKPGLDAVMVHNSGRSYRLYPRCLIVETVEVPDPGTVQYSQSLVDVVAELDANHHKVQHLYQVPPHSQLVDESPGVSAVMDYLVNEANGPEEASPDLVEAPDASEPVPEPPDSATGQPGASGAAVVNQEQELLRPAVPRHTGELVVSLQAFQAFTGYPPARVCVNHRLMELWYRNGLPRVQSWTNPLIGLQAILANAGFCGVQIEVERWPRPWDEVQLTPDGGPYHYRVFAAVDSGVHDPKPLADALWGTAVEPEPAPAATDPPVLKDIGVPRDFGELEGCLRDCDHAFTRMEISAALVSHLRQSMVTTRHRDCPVDALEEFCDSKGFPGIQVVEIPSAELLFRLV